MQATADSSQGADALGFVPIGRGVLIQRELKLPSIFAKRPSHQRLRTPVDARVFFVIETGGLLGRRWRCGAGSLAAYESHAELVKHILERGCFFGRKITGRLFLEHR